MLKVRLAAGSAHPERTDERYCFYDTAHDDYDYTEALVRKLARDLATPEGFRALLGREPESVGASGVEKEEL